MPGPIQVIGNVVGFPVRALRKKGNVQYDSDGSSSSDKTESVDEFDYLALQQAICANKVDEVDKRDVGTPDEWVLRHPDLVRLTGRHPFNVEPPLPKLMSCGFLTPASLHFVRNHGAVPILSWEKHRVTVDGAVPKKLSLSMDQIVNMPSYTLPITLVCAGNRRKEENMLKQTIGFSWGPAGLSTSLWTGVPLRLILNAAGVFKPTADAQFVCFCGSSDELPKGSYGTSIPLHMALDPAQDVMVAYKQNLQVLHPDHGYPVRIIIPGYIGGRMVKWLHNICVTKGPSENFYHFNDNRILPPNVDAEQATAEGWWYKPEYIFNQLNINSAMSSPAQGEELRLQNPGGMYTIRGYAYTGGGRQVTRCEVSLNGGLTWQLCKILQYEQPTEYGKYWCWVHFELSVRTSEIAMADQIMCRAWDAGSNTQPNHITWNVMGMGNNCCFRIRVSKKIVDGETVLYFEHPTEPGPALKGGWMGHQAGEWGLKHQVGDKDITRANGPAAEAQARSLVSALPEETGVSNTVSTSDIPLTGKAANPITMAEVKKHNTPEDCWIIVDGKVYDTNGYLKQHPGGAESITMYAGEDATEDFEAIHSRKAWGLLDDWLIGTLVGDKEARTPVADSDKKESDGSFSNFLSAPVALAGAKKTPFKLKEKIVVSHNTRIFRFELPSSRHLLGLPVGKHVLMSAKVDGKLVMRAYTPICSNKPGHFDILIKIYFKDQHPSFPDGGLLTQHLERVQIGESLDFKGPLGHVLYTGKGTYSLSGEAYKVDKIAMIAGGTGIAPIYQVIKAVCDDPDDKTELSLIFCNTTTDDILLFEELLQLSKDHANFKVWFTLTKPGPEWKFSTGRLNLSMMKELLPEPSLTTAVFMCCPPTMEEECCKPLLKQWGHADDMVVSF